MGRLSLAVVLGAVALAGCLGAPGAGAPIAASPTPTATPATTPSSVVGTTTASPTPRPTTGEVSVEYVVRAGPMPDAVAHVYVEFAVYVAANPDDVYACTDDAPLFDNRYDPTPTPLPTPAGRCARFDVPRIDIATLDGTRSLGEFTASGTFDGGHTLVVHDVTVVLRNGTTADRVHDTDFRAVTERSAPSGVHGVAFTVTDNRGTDRSVRWRFGVGTERFDPTAEEDG